ncbi:hypothetical protein [Clostridium perfringens]|uniref:Uncharacterized protein n=1 Tax=Clostridium perfringens D str. JGS1721 TaxID=488537 RepID=B1V6L6_CLOPF|nr:hypothetical protein [Clostridium perfringens]EDT70536.1 hypothetical protein CJD_A0527 [Clostridium perfringens D str. JGS1721]
MENNKKYLVKYNSQNYFCTCFDEIAEIMIGEENSETPITNRFLLIEMIKICAIMEGIEIYFEDSNYKKINSKNKVYLDIDDDDSIIKIINDLNLATILYLI